jgi:hypothetical protein
LRLSIQEALMRLLGQHQVYLVKLVHLVTADIRASAVRLGTAAQQVLLDTLEQAATAVEAVFQASVATLASVHQDILV